VIHRISRGRTPAARMALWLAAWHQHRLAVGGREGGGEERGEGEGGVGEARVMTVTLDADDVGEDERGLASGLASRFAKLSRGRVGHNTDSHSKEGWHRAVVVNEMRIGRHRRSQSCE